MQIPSIIDLLQTASALRAQCKTHRFEDLMRQLDALIELEDRDILIAGLDMITTAYQCRLEKLLSQQSAPSEKNFAEHDLHAYLPFKRESTISPKAQALLDHMEQKAELSDWRTLMDGFVQRQDALHSALIRFAEKRRAHAPANSTSPDSAPTSAAHPSATSINPSINRLLLCRVLLADCVEDLGLHPHLLQAGEAVSQLLGALPTSPAGSPRTGTMSQTPSDPSGEPDLTRIGSALPSLLAELQARQHAPATSVSPPFSSPQHPTTFVNPTDERFDH